MILRRIRQGSSASLALLFLMSSPAAAVVTISPAFVEVSLDRGRPAGQFVITNPGDEVERYRINAAHFVFGETGNLRMVPPDRNSLAPWIKFNPKELTVPPKSNMVVRFSIIPKEKLDEREYWAAMELESLKSNLSRRRDAAGRTMTLEVIPAIVVPIFGAKGRPRASCKMSEVVLRTGVTPQLLETRLINTGTGHLNLAGTFKITDAAGRVLEEGQIGGDYVLAGASRLFTRTLQKTIPPGEYVVCVVYTASRLEKPVVGEVKGFW